MTSHGCAPTIARALPKVAPKSCHEDDYRRCSRDDEMPREKRDVLGPIREKIKRKRFAVLDLESKKKDTQDKGFERPFLTCFFDGEEYVAHRDDEVHKGRSYVESYWHEPGGCIDKMMRHIVGLRACETCEISEHEYKWGKCRECVRARRRYQGKKWLLVAHNGGNFDNLFCLGWVRRHADLFEEGEIINVQSRMLIYTFRPRIDDRSRSEKWTFTDSIALLPLSLKEIGKTFCSDTPDFQKMVFNLDLPEDDENWEEYNRRDCAVLLEALNRFRKLVEKLGGAITATAAGTAMQLLRRKYLKKPIPRNSHFPDCDGKCHDDYCEIEDCQARDKRETECHGCLHKFVRDGFFGGRTEIYRTFGKRLIYSDINSSYPAGMLEDMPIGKARVLPEKTSLHMLKMLAKINIGFVECIIDVPTKCAQHKEFKPGCKVCTTAYLPPLPYRYFKKGGEVKLIFPSGRLYGTWDWVEIEEALKGGCKIVAVGKSVWFGKGKLFDKMIHTLYSYRQKKCPDCRCDQSGAKGKKQCACENPSRRWDAGLDFVAKLMMNSCFGKFATNTIREKIVFSDFIEDNAIIAPPWMKDAPKRVQHIIEADYIIPHIAAHITAGARVRLRRGLVSVLDQSGWIIYADTDSSMATHVVKPEGTDLGMWKIELQNFDVEVLLPKTYKMMMHEEECRDPECNACRILHKKECENEMCTGCISPIKVAMKGVPKGVQRGDVFDHLRSGHGLVTIDEKTGNLVETEVVEEKDDKGRISRTVRLAGNDNGDGGSVKLKVFGNGAIGFKRLLKHRGMLNPRRVMDSPIEEDAFRSMQSTYDKRRILPDGNTVPLIVRDPVTLREARLARLRKSRGILDECASAVA